MTTGIGCKEKHQLIEPKQLRTKKPKKNKTWYGHNQDEKTEKVIHKATGASYDTCTRKSRTNIKANYTLQISNLNIFWAEWSSERARIRTLAVMCPGLIKWTDDWTRTIFLNWTWISRSSNAYIDSFTWTGWRKIETGRKLLQTEVLKGD